MARTLPDRRPSKHPAFYADPINLIAHTRSGMKTYLKHLDKAQNTL